MRFSIIIPSYNQHLFIEQTLKNALQIRKDAAGRGDEVEILLFDSESEARVQEIISRYKEQLDHVEISKDDGQYDAINRGIRKASGDYWTWLNTDDTLDDKGFAKMAGILRREGTIDYIYGGIDYIDPEGRFMKAFPAYRIDEDTMVTRVPAIFQQGSFFRKAFTDKVGLLRKFDCCFDYEYVLRCLRNGARMFVCDFKVANFRQHPVSKTGSRTPVFIREQLSISHEYGRKPWHFLTWFSQLRLLKHRLFPR